MSGIQRWSDDGNPYAACLIHNDGGEWVNYEDHAAAMSAKDVELAPLLSELQITAAQLKELRGVNAEFLALRARVEELADEFDLRSSDPVKTAAQVMREKTYEQCADELRALLTEQGEK